MLEKMKKGKTNNTWAMACCPQNIVRFLSKKLPFNVKSGMLSVVFEARKTLMEGLSCKIDDFFTVQINCSLSPAYMCHPSWKLKICTPKSHIPHHSPPHPRFFFFQFCDVATVATIHKRKESQIQLQVRADSRHLLELCYVLANLQEPSVKIWQLTFLFSFECGQLKGI